MTKKNASTLGMALLLVAPGLVLAGCGNKHEHTYAAEWSYDASQHWHNCTYEGCEEKDGLGSHNFVNHPAVAATCSATGTIEYKSCSDCGVKVNAAGEIVNDITTAIVSSNHKFGDWHAEVKATCSATGTKGYKDCEYCSKHFDKDGNEIADLTIAIDPNAHKFGDWHAEVKATCSATGVKAHKDCEYCSKHFDKDGNEITDLTIAIDSSNHKFGTWIEEVAATCSATGVKAHKDCEYCSKHFDKDGNEIADLTIAIDPNAHSYGDWTTKTEAGYHQNKIEHRVCSLCGNEGETREISNTQTHQYGSSWEKDSTNHWHECECGEKSDVGAHTSGDDSVYKSAISSERGPVCVEHCAVCDKVVAIYEHSYGTPVITKEATYSEAGEQTETCTRCGYVNTTTVAKLSAKDRTITMSETTFTKEWGSDDLNATIQAKATVSKANASDTEVTAVTSGDYSVVYRAAETSDEFTTTVPSDIGKYEAKLKLSATEEWNAVESDILTVEITKATILLNEVQKLAVTDSTIGLLITTVEVNNKTVKVWAPAQYNTYGTSVVYVDDLFLTDENGDKTASHLANFKLSSTVTNRNTGKKYINVYVSDAARFVRSGTVQSFSLSEDLTELTLTFSVDSGILWNGDKLRRSDNHAPYLVVKSIKTSSGSSTIYALKGDDVLTVTFTRGDSAGTNFNAYQTSNNWVGKTLIYYAD